MSWVSVSGELEANQICILCPENGGEFCTYRDRLNYGRRRNEEWQFRTAPDNLVVLVLGRDYLGAVDELVAVVSADGA